MTTEFARIDLTSLQLRRMRSEVFCDEKLSREQRQAEVRKVLPFPSDGDRIEVYCDGKFMGKM